MRAIPPVIKEEIFRKFLGGDSITEISKQYDVSAGTISAITTEESNKDNDFFQIREITKTFKKHNLKISDIISGIRLYNKIKKLGLDIVFFENFIESIDAESFRLKKNIDIFLEDIKRIVQFEEKYQIKIENVPVDMDNMIKHHKELNGKKEKTVKEISKLYVQYNTKKSEIEEYIKEKPLFLQYKREKWRYEKRYDWFINPPIYEEASRKIGITIDPHILYKKLHWLFRFPYKHKALIKKIMAIDNDIFKSKLE